MRKLLSVSFISGSEAHRKEEKKTNKNTVVGSKRPKISNVKQLTLFWNTVYIQ